MISFLLAQFLPRYAHPFQPGFGNHLHANDCLLSISSPASPLKSWAIMTSLFKCPLGTAILINPQSGNNSTISLVFQAKSWFCSICKTHSPRGPHTLAFACLWGYNCDASHQRLSQDASCPPCPCSLFSSQGTLWDVATLLSVVMLQYNDFFGLPEIHLSLPLQPLGQ